MTKSKPNPNPNLYLSIPFHRSDLEGGSDGRDDSEEGGGGGRGGRGGDGARDRRSLVPAERQAMEASQGDRAGF